MLFATAVFATTSQERVAAQVAADDAAMSSWKTFEKMGIDLVTVLWWGWPFFVLLLALLIAYDVFVTNRNTERKDQAYRAHRNEMEYMNKLLEMHKAGMKVELPTATPDAPELTTTQPEAAQSGTTATEGGA